MFLKPYKMKSNNTLKNSEKKHLVQRILEEFPTVTEEKAKELVPVKATTSCMKLVLHSGDAVSVFVVESAPLLLDTAAGLVPTVCALWRAPDLLPTLTIHTPVLSKVVGGAPLYLPGVEAGGASWPMFAGGALLAARTADNGAAALVGRAALSSGDMLLRTTGVCMEVLQVFGDQLCKDPKFGKLERPRMAIAGPTPSEAASGLTAQLHQLNIEPARTPVKEEWPSLGRRQEPAHAPRVIPAATPPPSHPPQPAPTPPSTAPPSQPQLDGDDEDAADADEAATEAPPSAMGELLRWCLLRFLRLEGRTLQLPLKTNLLYKNHLFPYCPPDRTLDVKKSSYKKMSKFLEAMQEEGLVEVREVERGVWALTAASPLHPAVRAHRVPQEERERLRARAAPQSDGDYQAPRVAEVYCVTAAGAGLFGDLRKGTPLTSGEVRTRLTEYVRTRSLNSATQKGAVTLDAALAKATGKQEQETVSWEALSGGVLSRMTPGTALRWPSGETTLLRSRLEPISMAVVTRSGNKKVTLVSNLEAYGFSLPALSRSAQLLVGASCGVTRSPGAKADQLMLQGDQTHFVAKLLIEKYGLPKKYVDGADKALNKKK